MTRGARRTSNVTIMMTMLLFGIVAIVLYPYGADAQMASNKNDITRTSHFLFLGQSNMIGVGLKEARFNMTIDSLLVSDDDETVFQRLLPHLRTASSDPTTSAAIYSHEVRELLTMKKQGMFTGGHEGFQLPLPNVLCSFYEASPFTDYRISTDKPAARSVDANLSPYSGCGDIFGPELMFGHHIARSYPINTNVSIVKVASPGTELYRHWSKENGRIWPEVVDYVHAIDTTNDKWGALVWFQGESDSFEDANVDGYLGNMTLFVANLRQEIFDGDNNSQFEEPSDIPIVVVGMGCWITLSGHVQRGPDLQQHLLTFVENDSSASLVLTDDLSCNYHLDDASSMIIGARIAEAAIILLNIPSLSPSESPSNSIPSAAPSLNPSKVPSEAPSDDPSGVPSGSFTPSFSSEPSQEPSNVPSKTPSDQPSISQRPSQSTHPTNSQQPSQSAIPTTSPPPSQSVSPSNSLQPSLSAPPSNSRSPSLSVVPSQTSAASSTLPSKEVMSNSTNSSDDIGCFSAIGMVTTESKGLIAMADLEIGDRVLIMTSVTSFDEINPIAGDNSGVNAVFDTVYAFGHIHSTLEVSFLKIRTTVSSLEITPEHMILVEEQGSRLHVPASSIRVDSRLVMASGSLAIVREIGIVQRAGVYAPFTYSGTLVVNDIRVSSYIAFQASDVLVVGGVRTFFRYHWLAHAFEAPHRIASQCGINSENYSFDGVSIWVYLPFKAIKWLMQ